MRYSTGDLRATNTASRVEIFFKKYLRHVKGEWAGKQFRLMRWQRDQIVRPLFGTLRKDSTRQYRTAWIEIPSKNGKSSLAAGIALYLLCADREPGAEIYSAAGALDQARIVHGIAREMVRASPELRKRLVVYKDAIFDSRHKSIYRPISAKHLTKFGINAHGVIFDEVHVQATRNLWDTLEKMMAARRQPLMVGITTAGASVDSFCHQLHDYADKIKRGVLKNKNWFVFIKSADKKDDWRKPATWRKANPALGRTVKISALRAECAKAKDNPEDENSFKQQRLCVWTSQRERYVPMEAWQACGAEVDMKSLEGRPCWTGLDLASTTDIAAWGLVFPEYGDGKFAALCFFWIPGDNIAARVQKDRVDYDRWVKTGHIFATPGNVIDYGFIKKFMKEKAKVYDVREIAYDRWGMTQLSQDLMADGFSVVPFGQGFASMSAPTKELLSLVISGRFVHGGNPVLNWMADNMRVSRDAADNVKPDKKASREKIDGMVALVMALDRAIRCKKEKGSVYEERGIVSL